MTYNLAEFSFGTIYIDGILKIDETMPEVKIRANNIWVRGGKIAVGGPEEARRYRNKFTIELTGDSESPNLLIDEFSNTGTKSIAVTG